MISLIIPVYNSEKYLSRVLDSIFKQKFNDYEVVIVDDGSTDNSEKIIKEYMKKENKIKYVFQENMGPGIARKNGFKNCNGDLLFFIDSDDCLPNEYVLSEIDEIFKKNNKIDILFFDIIRNENNKEEQVSSFIESKNLIEGINDINYIDEHMIRGALTCKIFKKEIMKEDFFIDSNNFEDYFTTYAYLNECNNFYYIKKVFYYTYRDNMDSLTKTHNIEKIIKSVEVCKEINKLQKHKKITTKLLLNVNFNAVRYILHNEKKKCNKYLQILQSIVKISDYKIRYLNLKDIIKIVIIKSYYYIYR